MLDICTNGKNKSIQKEATSSASGSGDTKKKGTSLSLELMDVLSPADALEMPGFLCEGDLLEQMDHDDADIQELHDITFEEVDDEQPPPGPNL